MANANLARTAKNACVALEVAQKVVVVVGVLFAVGALVAGFYAPTPWVYGPIQSTEDWHSGMTGIVVAILALTQTLVVYAVLAGLDTKAEEVLYANTPGNVVV